MLCAAVSCRLHPAAGADGGGIPVAAAAAAAGGPLPAHHPAALAAALAAGNVGYVAAAVRSAMPHDQVASPTRCWHPDVGLSGQSDISSLKSALNRFW